MNTPSIGVAASFFNEHNALPGFLESASQFFDHVFLVDCSMDLSPSTDGSLDIIRKWGLPDPPRWGLANGFGAVRSQLIHSCPTDWVVVLDLDERMQVTARELKCHGEDRYPQVAQPNLKVTVEGVVYDHKKFLQSKIREAESNGIKCVRFSRRHWFTADFTKPCENWNIIRDFQLRCMKARAGVGYTVFPKMHERATEFATGKDPKYVEDDPRFGPFIEHRHILFKSMEPEQRRSDIEAYDQLHKSETHTPIPT